MAYNAPILDGVTLDNYPPRVEVEVEEINYKHNNIQGNLKYLSVAFRFVFTLTWDKSLVQHAMWLSLRTSINKNTSLTFRPFPDKYYNSVFTVDATNGLAGLKVFRHVSFGYQGDIVLETTAPVTTIPEWYTTT